MSRDAAYQRGGLKSDALYLAIILHFSEDGNIVLVFPPRNTVTDTAISPGLEIHDFTGFLINGEHFWDAVIYFLDNMQAQPKHKSGQPKTWTTKILRDSQGVASLRIPGPCYLTLDNYRPVQQYELDYRQLKNRDGLSRFATKHSNAHDEGLHLPDNILGGFVVDVKLLHGIEFGEDFAEAVDSVEDDIWTLSVEADYPVPPPISGEFALEL
jgi:hypothetical protein